MTTVQASEIAAIFDKLRDQRDAAVSERDALRTKLLDELSDSETQRLQAAAERDAARAEASFNRALVNKGAGDIKTLLEDTLELQAQLDKAIAERDALRNAATKFANTMAALSPRWTSEMAKAWTELFAVIGK